MDTAPLSAAHAHARNAAALSQTPNLTAAREEHELAAQDFAKARETVGDSEALRILNLLEHHHAQLASIIRSQSSPPKTSSTPKDGEITTTTTTTGEGTDKEKEKDTQHVPKLLSRTSTSPVRTRRLHRETSSSIADNLARQRRGLPAAAELSNLQAGGRILSHIERERPGYNNSKREGNVPSSVVVENRTGGVGVAPTAEVDKRKESEEGFSKFYTTFEGLFSKLSGPLAFAGLPLSGEPAPDRAEESTENTGNTSNHNKKNERPKPPQTRATSTDEPDLTKIYSAAALKAIREDVGPSFGPQESFYLVPPTGGTVSYAGMVSGATGTNSTRSSHHGIGGEIIREDDDEFVDARESIGPPSPRSLRGSQQARRGKGTASPAVVGVRDGGKAAGRPKSAGGGGVGVGVGGKTSEELEVENTVLRQLLDVQAKRLQTWEMSSQHQSMALQQSMRAVRQRPDLPTLPSDPSSPSLNQELQTVGEKELERIKELESVLERERREGEEVRERMERVKRENERLVGTVGRYRDKWEQLKAGARKREDDKRRKAGEVSGGGGKEDGGGKEAAGAGGK